MQECPRVRDFKELNPPWLWQPRAVGSKNELVRPYSDFEALVQASSSRGIRSSSYYYGWISASPSLDCICHHAHN